MGTIGSRLREAMAEKGLDVPDLVERKVMSRGGVYLWLNDQVKRDKVRDETVRKLCRVLGVERDWLLDGRPPKRAGQASATQVDPVAELQHEVHAIRLVLAALATVMVAHRPAEAADLVEALRRLPAEHAEQGLARQLIEALEPAVHALERARKAAPCS